MSNPSITASQALHAESADGAALLFEANRGNGEVTPELGAFVATLPLIRSALGATRLPPVLKGVVAEGTRPDEIEGDCAHDSCARRTASWIALDRLQQFVGEVVSLRAAAASV